MTDLLQWVGLAILGGWAVTERLLTRRKSNDLSAQDDSKLEQYARLYQKNQRALNEHIKSNLHKR